jgi:hypothetical protein
MIVVEVVGTPFTPGTTVGIGVSQGGNCCVGAAILLAQIRSEVFLDFITVFLCFCQSQDPRKSSVVSVEGSEKSVINNRHRKT